MFSHLIGHEAIKQQLERAVACSRLPQLLLFAGPEGVGKGLYARALASALLVPLGSEGHRRALSGFHPDLHEYTPEGKSGLHAIETMRSFSEQVYMAPYEAQQKLFILYAAERMQIYGANALLKTFEEPPLDTIILLVTHSPESLLPTIRSRCSLLSFGLLTVEEMVPWLQHRFSIAQEAALNLAKASRGSLARACDLMARGEVESPLITILRATRSERQQLMAQTLDALVEQIEVLPLAVERSELTALQRHRIEKEAAGTAALQSDVEVQALFADIVGWYRDLTLLHYGTSIASLWHASLREALILALQRGELLELDFVIAAVGEATLALQRSNPLRNVLETLFIRLRLY